jgi:hypothetical protein
MNLAKLGGALLMGIGMSYTTSASISKTTVFSIGENGSKYYRIPAVTTLGNGNIVAICDDRGASSADLSSNESIKLVGKISSDHGKSFDTSSEIAPKLGSQYGDAALVVDKYTGKLLCMFAAEEDIKHSTESSCGKIYITSSADGCSWEEPIDITDQIKAAIPSDYTYCGGFVSSGNMIYVPGNYQGTVYAAVVAKIYKTFTFLPEERQLVFIIKSIDKDRKEWTVVNTASYGNPVYKDGEESKLAQLSDGSLLLSMRTNGGAQRYFVSTDGGATWPTKYTGMTQPGCNGDMLQINYNAKSYLLQSAANSSSNYEKVSIYYSEDQGKTWALGTEVCSGNSRYSSLTKMWDGSVGCFVEEGDDTNGYDMNFYTMDITDILREQTISNTYDGSMVCNGKGYMSIPGNKAFDIAKNGKMTITCRVLLNDFTNTDNKDFGVLSTRWHAERASTSNFANFSGYEIIAGKSEDESLGVNVTIDNTNATTERVLKNGYHDAINPSRWAHVAVVFDLEEGTVKVYADGVLKETQTEEWIKSEAGNENGGLTDVKAKGGAITTNTRNLLVGTRYDFHQFTRTSELFGNYYGSVASLEKIFNSNIDDVRFYNTAFTQEEVLEDKNSGFPIRTKADGLIAAYDFADQDNTMTDGKFTDISGNGHDGTIATNNYEFPTIEHNIKVTPIKPNEEEGTLTVTRFNNGEEIVVENGSEYDASKNQDFKATAVAKEGWVLIGIYVNGVAVPQNGFFKAGEDAEVTALFRKEQDLNFYLVGNAFGTARTYNEDYKFTYIESAGNYQLEFPGNLQGNFRVVEYDNNHDAVEINLFADYEANNYGFKLMETSDPYNLKVFNAEDLSGVPFVVYSEGLIDNIHCLSNPTLVLTYTNSVKTLQISRGIWTGVEDIAVDNDKDAPVEYYNMQGMKVNINTAAPGIYIRRQGNKAIKIVH